MMRLPYTILAPESMRYPADDIERIQLINRWAGIWQTVIAGRLHEPS